MTKPWASWRWGCISLILAQWIPAYAGMTREGRNDGFAGSKAVVLVRFVNRGKVIVRITYHSIPRAARNLADSGTYLLGHGEARFGVAHLLVECPRPVVVAEHV